MLDPVDLSRNLALTTFELCVNYPSDLIPALSPLRKTLSTISSPAFSEFIFRFGGYAIEPLFLRPLSDLALWGNEWGMIDGELNDMIHVIGRDIRLVFQIGASGVGWFPTFRAVVGAAFPVMNARGLVSVEVAKSSLS